MRVSVFCGRGKCKLHRRPALLELRERACDITRVTDISRTWSRSDFLLDEHVAEKLAQTVGCDRCMVFLSRGHQQNPCFFPKCAEKMHLVDMFMEDAHATFVPFTAISMPGRGSDDSSSSSGNGGSSTSSLVPMHFCHHVSHEPMEAALAQKLVIISNSTANDPRFPLLKWPSHHVRVENMMFVPLVVGRLEHMQVVGLVAFMNRNFSVQPRRGGKCNGFSARDYAHVSSGLQDFAMTILTVSMTRQLKTADEKLKDAQKTYTQEMARMTKSQDTFIATMSHEIRTPLNAVNGYNEIMANHAGKNDVFGRSLRKQREAILQLTQLIANILDFSKLKSESLKLEASPFNFRDCVQRAVNMCAHECQRKNITCTVSVDDCVPEVFVGDQTRVYQVVANLVNNAVKYTAQGFVAVHATCTRENDLVKLRVQVKDSGRGVPVSLQKMIFEGFHQIREACGPPSYSSLQGVGLGLAICKELVTLMRGYIWVESDGQQGSTFVFTVLMRDMLSLEHLVQDAKKSLGNAPVLICDDLEVNRMVITKMFVEWGCRPHACCSVSEAMQLLKTFPPSYFRLAVIDVDLAGESGVKLAEFIAQDAALTGMLLIGVTSIGKYFDGSDVFDAVHEKPLHADDMLSNIVKMLQYGHQRTRHMPRSIALPGAVSSLPQPIPTRTAIPKTSNAKILIIDDDAPSVAVLRAMLQELGVGKRQVVSASSAARGLRMLAGNGNVSKDSVSKGSECNDSVSKGSESTSTISLVFMDIVMPEMDGIECTRQIRQAQDMYGTPIVVALTADALDATRESVLQAGAQEFASKPLSIDVLRGLLNKYQMLQ